MESDSNQSCFNCGGQHALASCDKGIVPATVWHNRSKWAACCSEGKDFTWEDPKRKKGKERVTDQAMGQNKGQDPEYVDPDPEVTVIRNEPWAVQDVATLMNACGIPTPQAMTTKGKELKLSFVNVTDAQKVHQLLEGQGLHVTLPPGLCLQKQDKMQKRLSGLEDEVCTMKTQLQTTNFLLLELSKKLDSLKAMGDNPPASSSALLHAELMELQFEIGVFKKSFLFYISAYMALPGPPAGPPPPRGQVPAPVPQDDPYTGLKLGLKSTFNPVVMTADGDKMAEDPKEEAAEDQEEQAKKLQRLG